MDKTPRLLRCISTGHSLADDGIITDEPGAASLLRAEYGETRFIPDKGAPGLFRYAGWLPVNRILEGSSAPVSYFGKTLGGRLGLSRLLVTFSGYWPERGAIMRTGTFKECEAYSVCARFPAGAGKLVVASAGNTARAFICVASENNIPLVVVIPEKNLESLYAVAPSSDCVSVVAVGGDSDYYDAIDLAGKICERPGFISEGGAKNVARRDGMGTTVLSAVETAGQIPAWYVQAVGSGTGAIAAHEANLRLTAAGYCEPRAMRLLLAQNEPFTPIADAWAKRSRVIEPADAAEEKALIERIAAKVLSNRKPPYGIAGGLYDALCASGGEMMTATNDELGAAAVLFEETEGCDICPEAGAALAALVKGVNAGLIGRDDLVMLNITGGGEKRIMLELTPSRVTASFVADPECLKSTGAVDDLCDRINQKIGRL